MTTPLMAPFLGVHVHLLYRLEEYHPPRSLSVCSIVVVIVTKRTHLPMENEPPFPPRTRAPELQLPVHHLPEESPARVRVHLNVRTSGDVVSQSGHVT